MPLRQCPLHISKVSNCTGGFNYKSDEEIPNFIDLHFGSGIVAIKDMNGDLIQLGTETKAKYQVSRKYTCKDYIAYIKNNHLYILGPEHLEYVKIEGILEDPTQAGECFDRDNTPYPVPANMIPTIKQMIFEREVIQQPNIKKSRGREEIYGIQPKLYACGRGRAGTKHLKIPCVQGNSQA